MRNCHERRIKERRLQRKRLRILRRKLRIQTGRIPNTISLTLDDDTEVECAVLTIFPVDSTEYIALLPLDENGQNQDGEVYLYTFSHTDAGDPMLANIESDEEYEKAAEAFNLILENARNAEEKGESLE